MPNAEDTMIDYLQKTYATALEVPEELVTPDTDLEAEFGLDSLQHRLVLSKAEQRWAVDLDHVESPATITVRSVAQLIKDAGATEQG